MKTKKWILPVCIVAGVILFLAIAFFAFAAFMNAKGYGMSSGRVLIARDDTYMLVVDENSPMRMSDRSESGDLFDGLRTGDKLIVIHNGIAESYPSQTGAYFIIKLGRGSIDDIPDKIIDELTQMGWLTSGNE